MATRVSSILTLLCAGASAFAPQTRTTLLLPQTRARTTLLRAGNPFEDFLGQFAPKTGASAASGPLVLPPSAVAVVGASGNVGKLVVLRLADQGYKVRAVVRGAGSKGRLADFLGDKASDVDIVVADVTAGDAAKQLAPAVTGAAACVVCTGTTAFPTKAWAAGDVAPDDVNGVVWDALTGASFDLKAAVEALSAQGLNTPARVDAAGVEAVADAVAAAGSCRRVVLMSSLGVTRREGFPFKVLNAAGVLDAKARGEAAIVDACGRSADCAYSIVRPGQLFGGPYDNNFYLGTLAKLDKDDGTQALAVQRGDEAAGDTLRSCLAEVIVQTLANANTVDTDYTVLTVKGDAPSVDAIQDQLTASLA